MNLRQTTIFNPISCYGIGVHSGKKTQITLKPTKSNIGIVFIRTDVKDRDNIIYANYLNVCDTTLSTSIKNDASVTVSTIEHLMAAIWGCNIDNMIIEIDGPEVPIMDGSSKPFVFMIECAGTRYLPQNKKRLKILKELYVEDKDSKLIISPNQQSSIDLTIDFKESVIGKQSHSLKTKNEFISEVANSRTFGFVRDLDYLKNKGLAQGASLDNAIGIDNNIILNHEGLRHPNEFAKHKLLDLVGDLFCCGSDLIGNIKGYKTSHALNNMLLRKILESDNNYEWI